MPIAIPTPRRKEAEQQLAADAPKGAPLKHGVGLSSRVHRRATRPAVAAAASAVDCGAGVPPARGWVGGGESGPMDRYAGRRPTPQERFPPRTPLSGGSAGARPRSPRPHRQLIVVRASRLHGAGLEGKSGPMDRYAGRRPTPREIPSPRPSLRWLRWLFGVTAIRGRNRYRDRNRIRSMSFGHADEARSTRLPSPRGSGRVLRGGNRFRCR